MGKKRGFHIVKIGRVFADASFFTVVYKRSKCRHAKTHRISVSAVDELAAYMRVKQFHQGANQ
jgi:hypothetical protein